MNRKLGKTRTALAFAVIISATAILASCEKYTYNPPAIDPNATWSFSADIQPIFNSHKCTDCHGGVQRPDLREGKSYAALKTGGYIAAPGENSRLYKQMASGHQGATQSDALKVLYWINQGAKNN